VAVRTAKMAMNRGLDLDLGNACALEASLFAAGFSTADREEGIAAFLEKRKANFTGK
jgi:enoyl-CoA hydratase